MGGEKIRSPDNGRFDEKKQQFCKQDSVEFYHLSEPDVTIRL